MSARVILSPKPNSFKFSEKIIDLSVPVKIGRANKDDKSSTDNGYFDCKVLSKPHALLMHEMSDFFLLDTGSSNGTFVNNIRLSKAGVESEPTQIFTGDILRFGSDVVDKSRAVTQRCVIIKVDLVNQDGTQHMTRPATSRLYRPTTDNFEDIGLITKNLQDSLSRERILEDKLVQILSLVQTIKEKSDDSKEDTKSFNTLGSNIQQEISKIYSATNNPCSDDKKWMENIRNEKAILRKEKLDLEEIINEKTIHCENLQRKAVEDNRKINSLGALILKLREDISKLETVVATVKETQEKVKADYEEQKMEERRAVEKELERLWKKDLESEAERLKLEEQIMYLMQYEPDSSQSSAMSTPTTIRQLGDISGISGLSTPTSSLFLTQDNQLRAPMEDNYDNESDVGTDDKNKEKEELLDSVSFELEVTKQELDMIKDENQKIRREVAENMEIAKKNVNVYEDLDKSRSEVQFLLSKITEKEERLESLTADNALLKSKAMKSWMCEAETDFESVFQENCGKNDGITDEGETREIKTIPARFKPKESTTKHAWLWDMKKYPAYIFGLLAFIVVIFGYFIQSGFK